MRCFRLWSLFFISTVLCLVFWFVSESYAKLQLEKQVQQQVPIAVDAGLQNSYGYGERLFRHMVERLNTDFATVKPTHSFALVDYCQIHFMEHLSDAASSRILSWQPGLIEQRLAYQLTCYPALPALIVSWLCLFILLGVFAYLWPAPYSGLQLFWFKQLQTDGVPQNKALQLIQLPLPDTVTSKKLLKQLYQSGVPYEDACQLCQVIKESVLTEEQLHWLVLAWKLQFPDEQCWQIAIAPNRLQFDFINQEVVIHGLRLKLSKTPLLYYYWYACKRKTVSDGWVLNPASNKPDEIAATELAGLMQQYHGHGKAISDLLSQGLKAKTLDQNRSKIRDEIVSLLGDKLAESYLFESQKDPRSGRSCYRLLLPAELIDITD